LLVWLTLSLVAKARPTKKKLRLNAAPEIAIPSPNAVVMMTLSCVLALRTFLVVADFMMMMLKRKPSITIARLWSEDIQEKHTTVQLKIGHLWIFHQARNVLGWMVLAVGVKRLPGSATMVLADPNS
jgi:hypothetical protein